MRFFCLKKFMYYLPGRIRHQFTSEFGIPMPPSEDMVSRAVTHAAAQLSVAAALGGRSRYTIREADWEDYPEWFKRVGRPYLFSEEMRESQRAMWFFEDWAEGFEVTMAAFYEKMHLAKARFELAVVAFLLSTLSQAGSSAST